MSEITNWNDYSASFLCVMPSEMVRLNEAVAGWMSGSVADFGCGAGKCIPYILSEPAVSRYIGVDMSEEMVKGARWMASQFPGKPYEIINSRIESVCFADKVDSALSINSFYSWDDPVSVLKHIAGQIIPGGCFVLVSINPFLDMPKLLDNARKEQVANPYWKDFQTHNLRIAESEDLNLPDLDELLGLVRESGFSVIEAHSKFYQGGLNFLILEKL